MSNHLTGTWALLKLALRRDRIMLPAWLAVLVAMAAGSAAATIPLYPTLAERIKASETINTTPPVVALNGLIYDESSIGAIAMVKLSGIGAILVAILAIILVVRHTRSEEDTGRLELVGSTVIGRHAALTAALIIGFGTNVVLGILTTLGLIAAGLPVAGSVAFGLGWMSVGFAFAAIAAAAAQVAGNGRAANSLAITLLGVTYVARAIGDTAGPRWLSWLSPVGWQQQLRPFAGERWSALLVSLAFTAVAVAGTYALAARRDLGAGLLPDRPGRARGAAFLGSPLGLVWRLQRAGLAAWAIGFLLLGLVLGNIASKVGNLLDNPDLQDIILRLGGEKGITDAFLAAEFGLASIIVSVYGVQSIMRLRSEEANTRAEPLLATGISRLGWAGSQVAMALFGTTILMFATGLGAGLAHGLALGDVGGELGRVLGAALAQLPAIWVLVGAVVALYGLVPRQVVLGWVVLLAFFLLGEMGPVLKLNQWVMDISPYAHSPKLPGPTLDYGPIFALVAVAAVLTAVGLVSFRRRDIVA
ncbi:ABC transporter permease [Paractinoplanes durhamensis]|uniref:Exporter of polyketide antibiotics n=1 Tax=Paractinoplanes durhamensis TaxID=113563 RepID=A0ABQ3ZE15_9ACTN|nr:ABC transporter permease [Actinoplanes durhamensis]GIE08080.1 exporter of polyketide antibiotics [Actinoplanes durhamensis]